MYLIYYSHKDFLTFPAWFLQCCQELSSNGDLPFPLSSSLFPYFEFRFWLFSLLQSSRLRNWKNSWWCWEVAQAWMSVTQCLCQLLVQVPQAPYCSKVKSEHLSEPRPFSACVSSYLIFCSTLQAAAFLHRISCRKCRKPHMPETKRHLKYCLKNTCKMLETTTSYTCSSIPYRWVCASQSISNFSVNYF